jgi:hypothetical protein
MKISALEGVGIDELINVILTKINEKSN